MRTEKKHGGGRGILVLMAAICMAFGLYFTTAEAEGRMNAYSGAVQLQVYDVVEERFYDLGIVYSDVYYSDFRRVRYRRLNIPVLAERIPEEASCGKVLDVEGNWCNPVGNCSEGETVLFFENTSQARITYWVNHYDPNGRANADGEGREDTKEAEAGGGPGRKWKQTIVFHSNNPYGPEDVVTVTYNVNSYISSSSSLYNGYVYSYDQCGFRLPAGCRLGKNYWSDSRDGTGKLYWRNAFTFYYTDAGSTCHLYAQYEAIPQDEEDCYEIAYHETDHSLLGVKRILKGQRALVGTAERGSSVLRGWNTDCDSESVEYKPGEVIVPEGDLQLYAVWNDQSIPAQYTVEWYDFAGNRIRETEERTGYVGDMVFVTEKDKAVDGYVWHPEHSQTVESAVLEPDGRTVLRLYFDVEYVSRDITVEKVFRGIRAEEIPDDFKIYYQVTNEEVPDFTPLSGVLGTEDAVRKWYTDGGEKESFPSLAWNFTIRLPRAIETQDGWLRASTIAYREENENVPGYRQTASSFEREQGSYREELDGGSASSQNLVLYNQYDRMITVTWLDGYRQGEEGMLKRISIMAGDDYGEQYPGDPKRDDYEFRGWGAPVADEWGNITITAQWKPSEPESSEPEPSEPESSEPESSEPESSEPEPSEPEPSEPESSEPESSEPESSEPEPSEPESSEPEPSEPESSEPEPSEPESSEPEPSEPESSEPESSEPEPSESESSEPEPSEPESSELEPSEPESSEPEPSEPESSASEPELPESEPSEPEPSVAESESSESEPSEPEPSESKPSELEPSEPEPLEPEPEESEPEESKPEPEIMTYSEESPVMTQQAQTAPVTGEDGSFYIWKPEIRILIYFSIFFLISAFFCGVKSAKRRVEESAGR